MQRMDIQRGCSLPHRVAWFAAGLQVVFFPGFFPEVCCSVLPLLASRALLFAGPRCIVISSIGLDSCAGILLTIRSTRLCLSVSRLNPLQVLAALQYHGATCHNFIKLPQCDVAQVPGVEPQMRQKVQLTSPNWHHRGRCQF